MAAATAAEMAILHETKDSDEKVLQKKTFECATRISIGALFHPLSYSKVLMQLGHEPLTLTRGKTYIIFGANTYFLPNIFKYANHIRKEKGFFGMYKGVDSSIAGGILSSAASIGFTMYIDKNYPTYGGTCVELNEIDERDLSDSLSFKRLMRNMIREATAKFVGTVVARPFQVIMIRQCAQFIGGETKYTDVYSSLRLIIDEEGWRGLFSGFMPQLIAELGVLCSCHVAIFLFERAWVHYVLAQSQQFMSSAHNITRGFIPYFINSVFYPFQVVATCMAVNMCGLAIGEPPMCPVFGGWQQCWDHLCDTKQQKRGAQAFLRSYNGPIRYQRDQIYASASTKML